MSASGEAAGMSNLQEFKQMYQNWTEECKQTIYHWKGYHLWIMTKTKSKQLNHRFES
jgi:hypothetical protein